MSEHRTRCIRQETDVNTIVRYPVQRLSPVHSLERTRLGVVASHIWLRRSNDSAWKRIHMPRLVRDVLLKLSRERKTVEDGDGNVGKTITLITQDKKRTWICEIRLTFAAVLLSCETSIAPFPRCLQNVVNISAIIVDLFVWEDTLKTVEFQRK